MLFIDGPYLGLLVLVPFPPPIASSVMNSSDGPPVQCPIAGLGPQKVALMRMDDFTSAATPRRDFDSVSHLPIQILW